MAEAAVFISLSASVDQSFQAIALSGVFLASSVGVIGGLAVCSAVLETSLASELQRRLAGRPDRESVCLKAHCLRNKLIVEQIVQNALSDMSYVLHLKGELHKIVMGAYVAAFFLSRSFVGFRGSCIPSLTPHQSERALGP